jgi:hypothetical protein
LTISLFFIRVASNKKIVAPQKKFNLISVKIIYFFKVLYL